MFEQLDPYVDVSLEDETVPAKLKINKKRGASVIATDTVELLVDHEKAA